MQQIVKLQSLTHSKNSNYQIPTHGGVSINHRDESRFRTVWPDDCTILTWRQYSLFVQKVFRKLGLADQIPILVHHKTGFNISHYVCHECSYLPLFLEEKFKSRYAEGNDQAEHIHS